MCQQLADPAYFTSSSLITEKYLVIAIAHQNLLNFQECPLYSTYKRMLQCKSH